MAAGALLISPLSPRAAVSQAKVRNNVMEPFSILEYLGEVWYDIKSLLLFTLNLLFLSGDLFLVNFYSMGFN